MKRTFAAALALATAACASQSQFLQSKQPSAVETALARGRFDLNCPTATAVVLSSDYIQPVATGPWVGAGITRAEYTIGVEGCGQRKTYVVMCQDETSTCFAAHAQ
jgi:hypothetical protein